MLFTDHFFQKFLMFPDEQKPLLSVCFKTSGKDFQILSQTIGLDFEFFKENQKLSPGVWKA